MSVGPAGQASGLRQSLWLDGTFPSFNDWIDAAKGYGGRGIGYSKLKKECTERVAWLAKAAKLRPVQRARLIFTWTEPKRNRDPDGFISGGLKPILDGLVVAGVLPGDGWGHITGMSHTWTSGDRPGVLVVVEEAAL